MTSCGGAGNKHDWPVHGLSVGGMLFARHVPDCLTPAPPPPPPQVMNVTYIIFAFASGVYTRVRCRQPVHTKQINLCPSPFSISPSRPSSILRTAPVHHRPHRHPQRILVVIRHRWGAGWVGDPTGKLSASFTKVDDRMCAEGPPPYLVTPLLLAAVSCSSCPRHSGLCHPRAGRLARPCREAPPGACMGCRKDGERGGNCG